MSNAPCTVADASYEDAWLACLDILGYRAMIEKAQKEKTEAAQIGKLKRALQRALGAADPQSLLAVWAGGLTTPVVSCRVFSDTVWVQGVRGPEGKDINVQSFLLGVTQVVVELVREGVFVRGGAVRGPHYDDGLLVFSPAVVRAYDMAEREAHYPRVIVDEHVSEAYTDWLSSSVSDPHDGLPPLLFQDDDRRQFLNYLFWGVTGFKGVDAPRIVLPWLGEHKRHIEAGLKAYRNCAHVGAKYGWLARYHNSFCGSCLPDAKQQNLLIEGYEMGMGPWVPVAPWVDPPH
jgi:hypothetical protein